eukprot:4879473-Pyramimonas_sp.AAC.1
MHVVYADGTLLLATPGASAEAHMHAAHRMGQQYGLQLTWRKLEALTVGADEGILQQDGTPIPQKRGIVYLGSLISDDGKI